MLKKPLPALIVPVTALLLAFVCAACASRPAAAPADQTVAPAEKSPAGTAAAPAAGQKSQAAGLYSVSLDANPSTGFSWRCEVANPAVADLSDSEYVQDPAPEGMVGVGGKETFFFTCKQPGSTGLTFTYRRPWQGGETAQVRRAQLVVDDDLKAKITFF